MSMFCYLMSHIAQEIDFDNDPGTIPWTGFPLHC